MKSILAFADRAYGWFTCAAGSLKSPLLFAVRLYWGWQFFQTGWGKLHNMPHVIEFFTSLGIPAPVFNAYFVSGLECFGGILLALGLGSRLIAFGAIGHNLSSLCWPIGHHTRQHGSSTILRPSSSYSGPILN